MDSVYQRAINKNRKKPKYFINSLKAFFIGGLICVLGEIMHCIYMNYFEFSKDDATTLMIVSLILLSALLTGFGIYDKLGQFAGAGSIVPVTGFANSMTSSAIEYRSEGVILGIATNLFKLAGSVITIGVVSAYILGAIRYALEHWIGIL